MTRVLFFAGTVVLSSLLPWQSATSPPRPCCPDSSRRQSRTSREASADKSRPDAHRGDGCDCGHAPTKRPPARAAAGKPGGADGLGHRRPLADPPGLSCLAGDDQSARPARGGGVRLHPGPAVPVGSEAAGFFVLRVRHAGKDVSPRDVRAVQGESPRHARRPRPANHLLPSGRPGVGDSGLGPAVVRGGRPSGHARPARRRARRTLLRRHRRQGLPAVDHGSGEAVQHPQERGLRSPVAA